MGFPILVKWHLYIICIQQYSDVTLSAMASPTAGIFTVCLAVCSGAYQIIHQSFTSLVFLWGIQWIPLTKGQLRGKCFYLMTSSWTPVVYFNSLRLRQNGRFFADDTFKRIFLNENIIISTKNSLKFVPEGLINNIPALVLIMVWRRPGDKPLSEPMLVRSLTHICVTRPQWVKWASSEKHLIFTWQSLLFPTLNICNLSNKVPGKLIVKVYV